MPTLLRPSASICGSLLLLLAAPQSFATPYLPVTPTEQVTELRQTWHDPARNRDIPLLICFPKNLSDNDGRGAEKLPIILFSHGLGGSRETYAPYGTQWAAHGYIVLFPQHLGSDTSIIGPKMLTMLQGRDDLQPFLDRVADIHFLIDQLEALANHKPNAPRPPRTRRPPRPLQNRHVRATPSAPSPPRPSQASTTPPPPKNSTSPTPALRPASPCPAPAPKTSTRTPPSTPSTSPSSTSPAPTTNSA